MEQLNIKTLSEIRELIQTELKKRSIHAKIIKFNQVENNGKYSIELETEEFQSQPVMFDSIKIYNFGSSIKEIEVSSVDDDTIIKRKCLGVYISLSYFFRLFTHGSNGVHLFTFQCRVYKSEKGYDHIAKVEIL